MIADQALKGGCADIEGAKGAIEKLLNQEIRTECRWQAKRRRLCASLQSRCVILCIRIFDRSLRACISHIRSIYIID